jgi:hypothetical protein
MRIWHPSPATVIALLALVMATSGTAIAAVDFARNSGAVDGKSAVSSSSSLSRAAGRLVATNKGGVDKGRIPGKFVAGVMKGGSATWVKGTDVADNGTAAAEGILTVPGFGTLTTTCQDQNNRAGVEDPQSVLTFTNQSGTGLSLARTVGGSNPFVAGLANATVHQWTMAGSSTFRLSLEKGAQVVLVDGVVRQDGAGTGAATCFTWGMVLAAGA